MTNWIYDGRPVEEKDYEGEYGFIYRIVNLQSGKRYIGKKQLWFRKTKTVKGRKKRYHVSSDWSEYWGSNKTLLEDIEKLGKENFSRTIIRFCKSKGELSYQEAKEQFNNDCLLDETYYNDLIRCRIHRNHVKKKMEKKDE